MKYKFKKTDYSYGTIPNNEGHYGVEVFDKSIEALEQIESFAWTSQEAQQLIDDSKVLQGYEELEYQVYGGHLLIIVDKEEAQFFSTFSSKKGADFSWSFAEFIEFMEAFKKYLTENGV